MPTLQVQLREDDADPTRLDELVYRLGQELLELDVDDVRRSSGSAVPPGARGIDVVDIGSLIVTFSQSMISLKPVVDAIKSWLSRGNKAGRTVKLEMAGDTLELSAASELQQQQLIDLFVARHMSGGDEAWTGNEKP
jgi:hypothetical protein